MVPSYSRGTRRERATTHLNDVFVLIELALDAFDVILLLLNDILVLLECGSIELDRFLKSLHFILQHVGIILVGVHHEIQVLKRSSTVKLSLLQCSTERLPCSARPIDRTMVTEECPVQPREREAVTVEYISAVDERCARVRFYLV